MNLEDVHRSLQMGQDSNGRRLRSISGSRKQKLCRVEQGSNCEARELQITYVMGMGTKAAEHNGGLNAEK